MRRTRWPGRRSSSILLLSLVVGIWAVVPSTAQEMISEEEEERVVEIFRKAYDEAREALEKFPAARYETDPALEAADYEARAIVDWVRENTRWVPYRGILRGADGVLLDRRGNSLDRSLLLSRLLEDAGYETRLVRGRLSSDAVERLLSQWTTSGSEPAEAESPFPEDLRSAASEAEAEAAALAALAALDENAASTRIEEAVEEHWWVEAKLDEGWNQLDALPNDDLNGSRLTPLERYAVDALPSSLDHRVTVRVVIERWAQGETVEEVPLEVTLRAAEKPYHDLELLFLPFHFEPALEAASATEEASAIAQTATEWLPVVRRGGEVIRDEGFDREGNLERDPGRVEVARKMEAATSALAGAGRSDEPDPTHLTACWLEYEIEVPGREPKIVRREIFDHFGPSQRRKGKLGDVAMDPDAVRERGRALLGNHRILVTSVELPPVALEKAAREFWAEHGPQVAALVRLMRDPTEEEPLGRLNRKPVLAFDLLTLATARHALAPFPSASYAASPNVLTSHFTVALGEPLAVSRTFDVVANEVAVMPGGSIPDVRVRMAQGVLDTILEAALSEEGVREGNAARLFARRGGEGGSWGVAEAKSLDSALPEEARARIANALDDGKLVVAPHGLASNREAAWWEIDPTTGTTLGIGPNGWGTEGTEKMVLETTSTVYTAPGAGRFGWTVNCKVLGAFLRTMGYMYRGASGGWTFTVEATGYILEYGCGGSPFLKP